MLCVFSYITCVKLIHNQLISLVFADRGRETLILDIRQDWYRQTINNYRKSTELSLNDDVN